MRCDGAALVNYKHEILEVLVGTLHLKCVQGYETVGQMLRYILRALTMYYPCDFRSISGSLDRPFSDYLAIRVSDFRVIILFSQLLDTIIIFIRYWTLIGTKTF